MIGLQYQAEIPPYLGEYSGEEKGEFKPPYLPAFTKLWLCSSVADVTIDHHQSSFQSPGTVYQKQSWSWAWWGLIGPAYHSSPWVTVAGRLWIPGQPEGRATIIRPCFRKTRKWAVVTRHGVPAQPSPAHSASQSVYATPANSLVSIEVAP